MELGVYAAKARLSKLIDEVANGAEVVITRHGTPVARIVPVERGRRRDRAKLIREILAYAKTLRVPKFDLRAAIDEGRD